MSWTINGTVIPSPQKKTISFNTKQVMNQVVSGKINYDYIGQERIVYQCSWDTIDYTDYLTIKSIYDQQRINNIPLLFVIDELGVSLNVIVVIVSVGFPINNSYQYSALEVNFIQS